MQYQKECFFCRMIWQEENQGIGKKEGLDILEQFPMDFEFFPNQKKISPEK